MNELHLVVDIPPAMPESAEGVATRVVEALDDRADELARDLRAVMADVSHLESGEAPLDHSCTANVRSVLAAMVTQTDFDPTSAAHTGAVQARRKMPLTSLNEFYRSAFRRLWDLVANEAAMDPGTNVEALRHLTSKLHAAEDMFMNAMVAGYRE